VSCIFCDIRDGRVPAGIIFNDDTLLAFHDVHPQAPVHVLIIPKKHIATLNDLSPAEMEVTAQLIWRAKEIAVDLNCAKTGYRLVLNCNRDGGQSVYHIHLHLLAGRFMTWPPG
jgi:histidine triad (HIT) family protein